MACPNARKRRVATEVRGIKREGGRANRLNGASAIVSLARGGPMVVGGRPRGTKADEEGFLAAAAVT